MIRYLQACAAESGAISLVLAGSPRNPLLRRANQHRADITSVGNVSPPNPSTWDSSTYAERRKHRWRHRHGRRRQQPSLRWVYDRTRHERNGRCKRHRQRFFMDYHRCVRWRIPSWRLWQRDTIDHQWRQCQYLLDLYGMVPRFKRYGHRRWSRVEFH